VRAREGVPRAQPADRQRAPVGRGAWVAHLRSCYAAAPWLEKGLFVAVGVMLATEGVADALQELGCAPGRADCVDGINGIDMPVVLLYDIGILLP